MVGFMGITRLNNMKMKRKDSDIVDQFSHDFSNFSLSSPARKIRRLDADLPPIMEEEEPPAIDDFEPESDSATATVADDQRAIVLFKPLKSPFFNASASPSNFNISLLLDSNFISGFKDHFIRSSHRARPIEEDSNSSSSSTCLAVIPWAPPPSHLSRTMASTEQPLEPLDAAEDDSMEIEECNENKNTTSTTELGQGSEGYEGLEQAQQWQQHDRMVPQPPHNASTPITWFPVTQNHY